MKLSREFDFIGLQLCKQQADLFMHASEKGIGSYYFVKRFVTSSLCDELDSLQILHSSNGEQIFWDENEKSILKQGQIIPPMVMHWIGYIYRYISYTENIKTLKLFKKINILYLASVYQPYHALDPKEAVKNIKESLGIDEEKRIKKVIEKYRAIYCA